MMQLATLLLLASSSELAVRLTLTTDKTCYFVGQPVAITLGVQNTGDRAVFGPRILDPSAASECCPVTLALCESGHPCSEVAVTPQRDREWTHMEVDHAELVAGDSRPPSTVTLALNGRSRPLISSVGRYRLRIQHGGYRSEPGYPPKPSHNTIDVQSNEISVVAPPLNEREALSRYLHPANLRVAQFRTGVYKPLEAGDVHVALEFLRKHPNSLYARPVIEGLKVALPLRVMDKNATDEEREAYEVFKRKEYPDPYVPECP